VFAFGRFAFGERRAVGGEDRGAGRQFGFRFQLFAAAQAGEDEEGGPVDAAFRPRQVELGVDDAEGHGFDLQRHRHHRLAFLGAGVFGRVGDQAAHRRDVARFAVLGDELLHPGRFLGGVVQLRVHGREILRLPGFGEAVGGVLLR